MHFQLCSAGVCGPRVRHQYVQPAVNRQPGYRWEDSDSWFRHQKSEISEKVHSGAPEIKDSWHVGYATSANQTRCVYDLNHANIQQADEIAGQETEL